MTRHPISLYVSIGTICGGTAGVAQAIMHGGSPISSLIMASLSGAAAGAIYGYGKLWLAARRRR